MKGRHVVSCLIIESIIRFQEIRFTDPVSDKYPTLYHLQYVLYIPYSGKVLQDIKFATLPIFFLKGDKADFVQNYERLTAKYLTLNKIATNSCHFYQLYNIFIIHLLWSTIDTKDICTYVCSAAMSCMVHIYDCL